MVGNNKQEWQLVAIFGDLSPGLDNTQVWNNLMWQIFHIGAACLELELASNMSPRKGNKHEQ